MGPCALPLASVPRWHGALVAWQGPSGVNIGNPSLPHSNSPPIPFSIAWLICILPECLVGFDRQLPLWSIGRCALCLPLAHCFVSPTGTVLLSSRAWCNSETTTSPPRTLLAQDERVVYAFSTSWMTLPANEPAASRAHPNSPSLARPPASLSQPLHYLDHRPRFDHLRLETVFIARAPCEAKLHPI